MTFSRRHFLVAGGLFGGGAYINQRGLRFPRLSFEPRSLAYHRKTKAAQITLNNCCFVTPLDSTDEHLTTRAYAPTATIELEMTSSSIQIEIGNIAAAAELQIESNSSVDIQEQQTGISRMLRINNAAEQFIRLAWRLPVQEQARFAIIGDTGGGNELDWCIYRAHQLNAEFLLHLGDFNYSAGEYSQAIKKFNASPIPVYVTIGNHDFNDSGLVYQQFRQQLGPMNSSFVVANTRFVNIDSAASFFPPYSGHRGALIRKLRQEPSDFSDQIFFTHKPFVDTRDGHHHNLSGWGEIDWVNQAMQDLGARHLLCGHVHRSSSLDVNGIQQWTAGEGLGFEDIRAQKQVAQILIGEAHTARKLQFKWHPLDMPWGDHTSPTHLQKLKKQGLNKQLEWYQSWANTA